jgi:two-component system chemotaxis response regulator CheY
MAKVLVVDDSKTVRSYHGSILKSLGLDVVESENGMEGIERSIEGDIELFIVDINMPVMDGYSFIKEIRQQEAYRVTPIIMISTQADDRDRIEAFKCGANFYKIKPIKPELLKWLIKILLPEHES